jgi:2'-5' RNA ligase
MKPTLRTFVAVEMDEAIRRAAARLIDELRAASAEVTWVAPHNMHLTVKFLGDVAAEKIPQVCEAVARAAADTKPFDLEVRGLGAFPNASRPRTIWLGLGSGEEELAALAGRVESALEELGFAREARGFHGHLTLGRVRRPTPALATLTRLLQNQPDFEAGLTPINEVVVFSSQLSPAGPTYEALSRARLAGPT